MGCNRRAKHDDRIFWCSRRGAGCVSVLLYAPHWKIGWRLVSAEDVWDSHHLGGIPWQVLANPAHRFFADPFPISWQGPTWLFFEDFDHRRGKAVISAVAFGVEGPESDAIPVLEEPWHLSYPFVIEYGGELWMIPESTGNKTVSIYRADAFPYRWVKEADLIRDIVASDATIASYQGLLWMFTTVREGAVVRPSSRALYLFYAQRLLGPWRPHACNPVLIDPGSARPARNMVIRDGQLWRPVQDCREAYGKAIGLTEVTRLDENGYQQVVRTILRPGRDWSGSRLHTLNRAGNLECIDGSALMLRCLAR